jgi:hypothetical protein
MRAFRVGRRPLVYAGFAALAALSLLICISMQRDQTKQSRTALEEQEDDEDYDDEQPYDERRYDSGYEEVRDARIDMCHYNRLQGDCFIFTFHSGASFSGDLHEPAQAFIYTGFVFVREHSWRIQHMILMAFCFFCPDGSRR